MDQSAAAASQMQELQARATEPQAMNAAMKRSPTAIERLENDFIGMKSMKDELKKAIAMAQYRDARRRAGKPLSATTMHVVLEGSPGTGKTDTAKIYGQALFEAGVLPGRDGKPVFVKTTPNEVEGQYRGWTSKQMREKFKEAEGGVLFIDEANSWLNPENEYGKEAMETLMPLAEDNREKVAVVLAGYNGLREGLGDVNPGLPSRFPSTINFPDLKPDEKVDVGLVQLQRDDFKMTPSARREYRKIMSGAMHGQGRDIRNFNQLMVQSLAARHGQIQGRDDTRDFDLYTITPADVKAAVAQYRDEFGEPLTVPEKPKKKVASRRGPVVEEPAGR